jgi:hypothetical protein
VKSIRLILTCAALVVGSIAFGQVTAGTPYPGGPIPGAVPGQGPGVIVQGTIPRVVSSTPTNGDQRAASSLKRITITFDQPMDTGAFFWPLPRNQQDFPQVTADPFWTNGNRTVNLPVNLAPNVTYRIPLNVGNQAFRSAQGVPLQPGVISFRTVYGGGTVTAPRTVGATPGVRGSSATPRVPGEGSTMGGASSAGGNPVGAQPTRVRGSAAPFMQQQQGGSVAGPGSGLQGTTRVRTTPTPGTQ